jgi:hypothetical protein
MKMMKRPLSIAFIFGALVFLFNRCDIVSDPEQSFPTPWQYHNCNTNRLPSNIVWDLAETVDGCILAGTQRGLGIHNDKTWRLGWPETISHFCKNNTLVLATANYSTLLIMENLSSNQQVISNEWFNCIQTFCDNNNYWVITKENELILFSTEAPVYYISSQYPKHINKDAVGQIWVSNAGTGLVVYSNNRLKYRYTIADGLSSNYVNCSFQASDNTIWIGTDSEKGLCKIENNSIKAYDFVSIGSIAEDKEGCLWLGSTTSGLYKWEKNGNIKHFGLTDGLPSNRITKVIVSSKNVLWVATEDAGIVSLNLSQQ